MCVFLPFSVFPYGHVSTPVHRSICIRTVYIFVSINTDVCVNVPTYAQPLKVCACNMCVHSFQVCVWRVVRDGGGSAPLTQPPSHADISRVEEIITLCSP